MNFLSGIIGALTIFCYLGCFSKLTGITIENLPIKGADLVFVTIPAALSYLPLPTLWIIFFFIVLFLIGIDSQIGNVKALVKLIQDLRPGFRGNIFSEPMIRIGVIVVLAILGLVYTTARGFEFIQFIDGYCLFLPFLVVAGVKLYLFRLLNSETCRLQAFVGPAAKVHFGEVSRVRVLLS